jgi:dCMP deaminase
MKDKFVSAYIDVAERFSKLSTAKKLQVGAIVVKDDRIISIGYNGMPSGWDNTCEEEIKWPNGDIQFLQTKPEVLHAEANAITKLAKSSESGEGADIFITHSPCIECAKLIYQSGIKKVIYKNDYRTNQGIEFLHQCGIEVKKYEQS